MGLFNRMIYGNPNKPDLEVEQNQNPITAFFEVLKIKMWDLVKLNLLFLIFVAPALIWAGINFNLINTALSSTQAEVMDLGVFMESGAFQYLTVFFMGLIPCLLIMGVGLPSLNYITKTYAKESHVWLMEDFLEKIKENWKQSLLYMLLLGSIVLIMYYGIATYAINADAIPMAKVLRGISYFMLGLILLSTTFVYPLMVTFELKLKNLIKNSVLLAIAKLPQTLLILLISAVIPFLLLLLSMAWNYGILVFGAYYVLFGFAFNSLIINSFTNQVFKKIIVANGIQQAGQKPETEHKDK